MDRTGPAHVISLFSKACRDEHFNKDELETGNMDREKIISLLTEEERNNMGDLYQKIAHQLIPSLSPTPNPKPPRCVWACFNFSFSALNELKSLASKDLTCNTNYITTDDALAAFIWQ